MAGEQIQTPIQQYNTPTPEISKTSSTKGNLLIPIIVIVIIIIAAVSFYGFGMKKQNAPTTISNTNQKSTVLYTTTISNNIQNQKFSIYTNATYKYIIQYPSSWYVNQTITTIGAHDVYFTNQSTNATFLISVINDSNRTPAELPFIANGTISELKLLFAPFDLISKSNTTISSQKAIEFTYTFGSGSKEAEVTQYIFVSKRNFYTLLYTTDANGFESNLSTQERIIGSFNLT